MLFRSSTGEIKWTYSMDEGERATRWAPRQLSGRGLSYWTDGKGDDRVVYVTTGYRLVSLNAKTGQPVAGFTFTTSEGKRLAIEEFRGKPLLVTLIYTSCADVCPAVIESLAAAADAADGELGADSYRVLTVGFDTANDTPDRIDRKSTRLNSSH